MFDRAAETMPRDAMAELRIGRSRATVRISVDVVVKPPGSLARAPRKAQRVRDLRPH